jgi:hypothetical protein
MIRISEATALDLADTCDRMRFIMSDYNIYPSGEVAAHIANCGECQELI